MTGIAGLEVGLPRSIDEVDAAWMTEVLRCSGAIDGDTSVTGIDCQPFAVGAGLLSLLFRASLTYSGAAPDAPSTVVVKLPMDHPVQRGIADGLGFYPREIRFYRELAPKSDLRTPVVHAAMIADDCTDFVVVMQDLSNHGVADQRVGATWEQACASVDAMAAFHAPWCGCDELAGLAGTFPPLLNPVYQQVLPQVFASGFAHAKIHAPDLLQPELLAFGDRYGELMDFMLTANNEPATIIHGDWRLDNLFFGDDGSVTVIDFQITGQGSGAYDLGYFVSQSIATEVRRGREMELIDRYLDGLAARGVQRDRDEFVRQFKIAVAQCFIYGISSFESYPDLPQRSKDLMRLLLDRSARTILDMDALAELPS